MKIFLPIIFLITSSLYSDEPIDLEEKVQDFVIETKKIDIPGYPLAFNPSIVRWQGRLLMSFRIIPNRKDSFTTLMGVVWLDDDFSPISEPQIIETRAPDSLIPPRGEDARLLAVGDCLYFIFDDCNEPKISKAGFRMYYAQLQNDGERFFLKNLECISRYEGESPGIREKNWVPFDYQGNLLLAYSLTPHRIFYPLFKTGECTTIAATQRTVDWRWGLLRGGTPGLLINGEYLAFFHSSIDMASLHSEGKKIAHYFMGAYTFAAEPPFAITRISPEPIVSKGFYNGAAYKPYWKPVQVVFPCGFIHDERHIWVAYGRQDHETWVVKLDKNKLLQSLIPVTPGEAEERPAEPEPSCP